MGGSCVSWQNSEIRDATDVGALNIVFFASDEPFTFNVPTHGEYEIATENTYFDVRTAWRDMAVCSWMEAHSTPSLMALCR
jgi:hypothetical protein